MALPRGHRWLLLVTIYLVSCVLSSSAVINRRASCFLTSPTTVSVPAVTTTTTIPTETTTTTTIPTETTTTTTTPTETTTTTTTPTETTTTTTTDTGSTINRTSDQHKFSCTLVKKGPVVTMTSSSGLSARRYESQDVDNQEGCETRLLPPQCLDTDPQLVQLSGLPCECNIFPRGFDVDELPAWCRCLLCSDTARVLPLDVFPVLGHTYYLHFYRNCKQTPDYRHRLLCSLGSQDGRLLDRGNKTFTSRRAGHSITLLQDGPMYKRPRVELLLNMLTLPDVCLVFILKYELLSQEEKCFFTRVLTIYLGRAVDSKDFYYRTCLQELKALRNYIQINENSSFLYEGNLSLHFQVTGSLPRLCVICFMYTKHHLSTPHCSTCIINSFISKDKKSDVSSGRNYYLMVKAEDEACLSCLKDLPTTSGLLEAQVLHHQGEVNVSFRTSETNFLPNNTQYKFKMTLLNLGLKSCSSLSYLRLEYPFDKYWYVHNGSDELISQTRNPCLENIGTICRSVQNSKELKIFECLWIKLVFLIKCHIKHLMNYYTMLDMFHCNQTDDLSSLCERRLHLSRYLHPSNKVLVLIMDQKYHRSLFDKIYLQRLNQVTLDTDLIFEIFYTKYRSAGECVAATDLQQLGSLLLSPWGHRHLVSRCFVINNPSEDVYFNFFQIPDTGCVKSETITTNNITISMMSTEDEELDGLDDDNWYKMNHSCRRIYMRPPGLACPPLTPHSPDFQAVLDVATGAIANGDTLCLKALCSGKFNLRGVDGDGVALVGPVTDTLAGGNCLKYLPPRFWKWLQEAYNKRRVTINKFWSTDLVDYMVLYPLKGPQVIVDWSYVSHKWWEVSLCLVAAVVTVAIISGNTLVLVTLITGGHHGEPQSLLRASLAVADLLMGLFPATLAVHDHVAITLGSLDIYDLDTEALFAYITVSQKDFPTLFRQLYFKRPGYPAFCGFIFTLSVTASLLTLLSLSHERYTRTSRPLKVNRLITLSKVMTMIFVAWVLSLLFSIIVFLTREESVRFIGFFDPISKLTLCLPTGGDTSVSSVIMYLHISIVGLSTAATSVHSARAILAWRVEVNRQKEDQKMWHSFVQVDDKWTKQDQQVTVSLTIMMVVFMASLLPVLLDSALALRTRAPVVHYFTWWTLVAASATNPIVYNLRSQQFRKDVLSLLCHSRHLSHQPPSRPTDTNTETKT